MFTIGKFKRSHRFFFISRHQYCNITELYKINGRAPFFITDKLMHWNRAFQSAVAWLLVNVGYYGMGGVGCFRYSDSSLFVSTIFIHTYAGPFTKILLLKLLILLCYVLPLLSISANVSLLSCVFFFLCSKVRWRVTCNPHFLLFSLSSFTWNWIVSTFTRTGSAIDSLQRGFRVAW